MKYTIILNNKQRNLFEKNLFTSCFTLKSHSQSLLHGWLFKVVANATTASIIYTGNIILSIGSTTCTVFSSWEVVHCGWREDEARDPVPACIMGRDTSAAIHRQRDVNLGYVKLRMYAQHEEQCLNLAVAKLSRRPQDSTHHMLQSLNHQQTRPNTSISVPTPGNRPKSPVVVRSPVLQNQITLRHHRLHSNKPQSVRLQQKRSLSLFFSAENVSVSSEVERSLIDH